MKYIVGIFFSISMISCTKTPIKVLVFMYSDKMETSVAITPNDIKNAATDSAVVIDDTLHIHSSYLYSISQEFIHAKKENSIHTDARVYIRIGFQEFVLGAHSQVTDINGKCIKLPNKVCKDVMYLWKSYIRCREKNNTIDNRIPSTKPKKEYWKILIYLES